MNGNDPNPRQAKLVHDLAVLDTRAITRRRALGLIAGGGVTVLMARRASADAGFAEADAAACEMLPEEGRGPFPADGTGSARGTIPNILAQSGIVRSDITRSFGSRSTVAPGVPLRLSIRLQDVDGACAALVEHAVYVWQCDREGQYSLYSGELARENYLRGVQLTDDKGEVTFQTIVPACYPGRYPHIHVEVFSRDAVMSGFKNSILASQLIMPRGVCERVYRHGSGYGESLRHLARVTVATDQVFDSSTAAQVAAQTPAIAGSPDAGYTGAVRIGIRGAGRSSTAPNLHRGRRAVLARLSDRPTDAPRTKA